ncbi:MAG: ABC transporter substrate-binding protein [Chloracidobacterium sp.]|nr:ABC transporter substrate-binding protein [Chloracidobacterium sp.]
MLKPLFLRLRGRLFATNCFQISSRSRSSRQGTAAEQKDKPVGSGPFKFISFDASQNIVELAANPEYWEGAPKIAKLRVKTVTDATSLQAELQSGGVDIAPNPSNLPPDMLKTMSSGNLKVDQFDGSNIQYLVFNTQSAPLNNPKVRQAIGYAIDRQKIVTELLSGQAKVASSILPPQSWAYTAGTAYKFDPAKAKQLLQEAGYKNEPITFKYGGGTVSCCNRSRYANNEVDKLVEDAVNSVDKAAATSLYGKTWDLVSSELPLLPLWYPANIVVSNKRIGNVKMSGSGDWSFLKDITLQ